METNNLSRFDTELKYKVVVDKTDDGNIRFCLIDSEDRKEGIVLCSAYVKRDRLINHSKDILNLDDLTDEQFIKEIVKPQLIKLRCHIRFKVKEGELIVYIGDKREVKKLSELK